MRQLHKVKHMPYQGLSWSVGKNDPTSASETPGFVAFGRCLFNVAQTDGLRNQSGIVSDTLGFRKVKLASYRNQDYNFHPDCLHRLRVPRTSGLFVYGDR
jgi:hypothetical protein